MVLKLFNCVQPGAAVFGKKDYQQLIVVRALAPAEPAVEIIAGETVREADGLAMSSRNAYLSPAERAEAPRLCRSPEVARGRVSADQAMKRLLAAGWKPDYVEVRRRHDLAPPGGGPGAGRPRRGALGATRLDNLEF